MDMEISSACIRRVVLAALLTLIVGPVVAFSAFAALGADVPFSAFAAVAADASLTALASTVLEDLEKRAPAPADAATSLVVITTLSVVVIAMSTVFEPRISAIYGDSTTDDMENCSSSASNLIDIDIDMGGCSSVCVCNFRVRSELLRSSVAAVAGDTRRWMSGWFATCAAVSTVD